MSDPLGKPFWRLYWLDDERAFKQQAYTERSTADREMSVLSANPGVVCVWLEECKVVGRVQREGG